MIIFTISIKLFISNQEIKIKKFRQEISKVDSEISKKETDISYSTRPQQLELINKEEFGFRPILQSDIIKLKKE